VGDVQGDFVTQAIHQHYLAPLATPNQRRGSVVFAREIVGSSEWLASLWDRRAQLPSARVLLAWGMKDIAFREKELERWHSLFPDARTVKYADCGHFVAEEQWHERAGEILDLTG